MTFSLDGFTGFVPFADLPAGDVPTGSGVYVVTRPASSPPVFLPQSPAGRFKGKEPTVSVSELQESWVPGEPVLYIGKADIGRSGKRGLRTRLSEYRRHGSGRAVGHWGGRMIWQLADSADLLVAWRPADDGRALEKSMIADFVTMYGRRPFANRTG
ncbi:hypothetical protein [Millisia brevis]|uniref:hypothetical protein n=1 Tax=Millisia brevis TaxID=264148 RepID=UPI00082FD9A8|nr:hypothetical protein [Millisia brevis]